VSGITSEARAGVVSRGATQDTRAVEPKHSIALSLVSRPQLVKPTAVLFGLLVFAVLVSMQRQFFVSMIDHEITQINVHGELSHLNVERIENRLGAILGSSFLMADLLQIKSQVESLPWVFSCTVTRVWPGGINLFVEEQVAVAYWNEDAYLNADGVVFSPKEMVSNLSLPKLVGPLAESQRVRGNMLETLEHLQVLLDPYDLHANKLELEPRGVWSIALDNGVSIALGSQPFESKIERLGVVFSETSVVAKDKIKKIDMRYPNGVAIKWKEIVIAAGNKP